MFPSKLPRISEAFLLVLVCCFSSLFLREFGVDFSLQRLHGEGSGVLYSHSVTAWAARDHRPDNDSWLLHLTWFYTEKLLLLSTKVRNNESCDHDETLLNSDVSRRCFPALGGAACCCMCWHIKHLERSSTLIFQVGEKTRAGQKAGDEWTEQYNRWSNTASRHSHSVLAESCSLFLPMIHLVTPSPATRRRTNRRRRQNSSFNLPAVRFEGIS